VCINQGILKKPDATVELSTLSYYWLLDLTENFICLLSDIDEVYYQYRSSNALFLNLIAINRRH
jgi:hypothetical protein